MVLGVKYPFCLFAERQEGIDLTEVDVDAQIKRYWASKERLIPQDILDWMEDRCRDFEDATADNPVDAMEFLSHLDLSFAEEFLGSLYRRDPLFPPVAVVKALLLTDLKGKRFYTKLRIVLRSHPEKSEKLGFPVKDGEVLIPSEKTLWHFDNVRMGSRWNEFFVLLRNEIVRKGGELGLEIGERTMEDSMPILSFHTDKEAEYNDHYKIKGYKLDTVDDLETRIPLSKETIGINEDEAKCLIPHMEDMRNSGIRVKENWMDGGYDDYPNIAWLGVHGIESHHPIHENWVMNNKGSEKNLRRLYQKHWKDDDFHTHADMKYILSFLLRRGYEEEVGAHFRNINMQRYHEDPEGYMNVYHKRSRKEGNHGYWKEHIQLEKRLRRKGLERVDRYLTRNLCAVLSVALNRLQHGIKSNLTSVAYLA